MKYDANDLREISAIELSTCHQLGGGELTGTLSFGQAAVGALMGGLLSILLTKVMQKEVDAAARFLRAQVIRFSLASWRGVVNGAAAITRPGTAPARAIRNLQNAVNYMRGAQPNAGRMIEIVIMR